MHMRLPICRRVHDVLQLVTRGDVPYSVQYSCRKKEDISVRAIHTTVQLVQCRSLNYLRDQSVTRRSMKAADLPSFIAKLHTPLPQEEAPVALSLRSIFVNKSLPSFTWRALLPSRSEYLKMAQDTKGTKGQPVMRYRSCLVHYLINYLHSVHSLIRLSNRKPG